MGMVKLTDEQMLKLYTEFKKLEAIKEIADTILSIYQSKASYVRELFELCNIPLDKEIKFNFKENAVEWKDDDNEEVKGDG